MHSIDMLPPQNTHRSPLNRPILETEGARQGEVTQSLNWTLLSSCLTHPSPLLLLWTKERAHTYICNSNGGEAQSLVAAARFSGQLVHASWRCKSQQQSEHLAGVGLFEMASKRL